MIRINLLNFFKIFHNRNGDENLDGIEELSYFNCEDSVEAALNYLDNHPDCTYEEYEEWLQGREDAIALINKNYKRK